MEILFTFEYPYVVAIFTYDMLTISLGGLERKKADIKQISYFV
jgi:hypothetical protein